MRVAIHAHQEQTGVLRYGFGSYDDEVSMHHVLVYAWKDKHGAYKEFLVKHVEQMLKLYEAIYKKEKPTIFNSCMLFSYLCTELTILLMY